jgi:hypothetical protein
LEFMDGRLVRDAGAIHLRDQRFQLIFHDGYPGEQN